MQKGKSLYLGVVCTCLALDYLAVLVPHRTPFPEDSHTVFGIIIQMARPQGIVVLVHQLDYIPPEFRKIIVYAVDHLFAFQLRPVLDDTDIAYSFYDTGVHIPQGGITQQIGIVVQKDGISGGTPVHHSSALHLT